MDVLTAEAKISKSRSLYIWLGMLVILYIKSNIVIFSMYSFNTITAAYGFLSIIPIIFIISFSLLFSDKGQVIYLFIADLIISMFLLTDLIYGRAFGQLISLYTILSKNRIDSLGAGIISLIKWWDFLIIVDLPVAFALVFKVKKRPNLWIRKVLCLVCAVIGAFVMVFHFIRMEDSKALGHINNLPLFMTPIGYHFYDFYRFNYERLDKLDKKDIAEIEKWFDDNEKYQEPDDDFLYLQGALKGKNIIVVQFESLEENVIGKSYFGREITPSINKLLENSIYFNNIHEQVRDGNSSDAELLMLTSMYPLRSGSAFLRYGENTYASLPKLLHQEGYTSVAIHGDDERFWNRNIVFPKIGFDRYITEEEFEDKRMCGLGVIDESLFSQSLMDIKKIAEPYNFHIITITSHMPFELYGIEFEDFPEKGVTGDYLRSIQYTDKLLGEFLERLFENNMMDNTAIIVFGDHEGLHKYFSSEAKIPDNNYKIPFIIYIPGFEGFEVNTLGGQVDLMPTLSYLLGIDEEKYSRSAMGRNLFRAKSGGAVALTSGEILDNSNSYSHISAAQNIAQLIIRGNYFGARDTDQ